MTTSIDTPTATTLGSPLTLAGGAVIKNRLVKAAMSEQLAGPAGSRRPSSRAPTAAGPRAAWASASPATS